MFVMQCMTRNPINVTKDTTIGDAYRLMREKNVTLLPIVDGRDLVGVVSAKDIRQHCLVVKKEMITYDLSTTTKVEEIMERMPVIISQYDPIENAAWLIHTQKISGLPVVDNGKLMGIITQEDIFHIFVEVLGFSDRNARLTLDCPDKPGSLLNAMSIIRDFGVNIVSFVAFPHKQEGRRIVVLRINTQNIAVLTDALEKAGYIITQVRDFTE